MTTDDSGLEKRTLRGIYPRDGGWGHKIVFDDYESKKVYGFLSRPKASEGLLFGYQMESGRIGVFELVEVDNMLNPSDQFFGKAKPLGYLDEMDDVEENPNRGLFS